MNRSQLNQRRDDLKITYVFGNPDASTAKLIKVSIADRIGYAETEDETIQMIEKLPKW